MSDLVTLAERFLHLSRELAETKDAMRRLLSNGGGEVPSNGGDPDSPFAAAPSQPGGARRVRAQQAEDAILTALQATPNLTTVQIARATGARPNTTALRLERMQSRGQITRGNGRCGEWSVAPAPAE
jgi:hypothetical protein